MPGSEMPKINGLCSLSVSYTARGVPTKPGWCTGTPGPVLPPRERGRNSRVGSQADWKPHETGAKSRRVTEASVGEAPASFGPLIGTRCGFDYVGGSVPSSQMWKTLTFLAGVVAEVWLWSDEEEAKTCAYNEGPVWLETPKGGAARPMQGTLSPWGPGTWPWLPCRRAGPAIRASILDCLVVCFMGASRVSG